MRIYEMVFFCRKDYHRDRSEYKTTCSTHCSLPHIGKHIGDIKCSDRHPHEPRTLSEASPSFKNFLKSDRIRFAPQTKIPILPPTFSTTTAITQGEIILFLAYPISSIWASRSARLRAAVSCSARNLAAFSSSRRAFFRFPFESSLGSRQYSGVAFSCARRFNSEAGVISLQRAATRLLNHRLSSRGISARPVPVLEPVCASGSALQKPGW